MTEKEYQHILQLLHSSDTLLPLYQTARLIPSMTGTQRKALITLCRSQVMPTIYDTRLCQRVAPLLQLPGIDHFSLSIIVPDPILAGLLINLTLFAPLDQAEITRARRDSVYKELTVMESSPRGSAINYDPFFIRESAEEPIHVDAPSNHEMNDKIRQAFHTWKTSCEGRIFWPHLTKKAVAKSTADTLLANGFELSDGEDFVTSADLERNYVETGEWIEGPCQMKQKWYPAHLVPRTYYASGGTAFRTAKYLRNCFNDLADYLSPIHRHSRVEKNRLRCEPGQYFFMYDLSSFTSNFHEHRYFLDRLGEFCRGTTVFLADGRDLLTEADLGELILEYNHSMNYLPDYEADGLIIPGELVRLVHGTAGFLGVFGNLITCTIPHGICMMQYCTRDENLSVAGDDGALATYDHTIPSQTIHLLGSFADDKVYTSLESAVYLKRKFVQVGNNGVIGQMVIWPLFAWLSTKDSRWSYLSSNSRDNCRHAVASAIFSFSQQLFIISKGNLTNLQREAVSTIMGYLYNRFALPVTGNLPQSGGNQILGLVPIRDLIGLEDPVLSTLNMHYTGVAKVSYLSNSPFRLDHDWEEDEEAEGNMTPGLMYYFKVGWVGFEEITEIATGYDGYVRLMRDLYRLVKHGTKTYRFVALRQIPLRVLQIHGVVIDS